MTGFIWLVFMHSTYLKKGEMARSSPFIMSCTNSETAHFPLSRRRFPANSSSAFSMRSASHSTSKARSNKKRRLPWKKTTCAWPVAWRSAVTLTVPRTSPFLPAPTFSGVGRFTTVPSRYRASRSTAQSVQSTYARELRQFEELKGFPHLYWVTWCGGAVKCDQFENAT